MKIYKKILNLGYGICCLLPILYLLFGFLYVIKTGENATFDISNTANWISLGGSFTFFVKGELYSFIDSLEWFHPFAQFNSWFASTFLGENDILKIIQDNDCITHVFVLFYSEWVVLVSFFRLFGSVFGCMINFADRMLDKIGGTN